jgi:hypothetical protein
LAFHVCSYSIEAKQQLLSVLCIARFARRVLPTSASTSIILDLVRHAAVAAARIAATLMAAAAALSNRIISYC